MKQQITIFFAISLAIFALGYTAFVYFSSAGNPSSDNAVTQYAVSPTPPKPSRGFVVKSVTGTATRTGGRSDEWVPVEPGNELLADQRIRTEQNASVRLAVDDQSKIELLGQSELSVESVSADIHKIKLESGQAQVDYAKKKKRVLEVRAQDNQAVAATKDGTFVIQNADGQVSVAARKGTVELTAEDKTVSIGPNTISHVLPGKAPQAPSPIPLKVMLRVANPQKLHQLEESTKVAGTTNIGAIVTINDRPATVDERGRFEVDVPLDSGKNTIQVQAKTPWGSAQTTLPDITVINRVPKDAKTIDSAKVRWGSKKSKKKR